MSLIRSMIAAFVLGLLSHHAIATGEDVNSNKQQIRLLAGGDIIFHGALLVQALSQGHGFESLFRHMEGVLSQADLLYGNLEGPAAWNVGPDGRHVARTTEEYSPTDGVYSVGSEGRSYSFNFHPQSVVALKQIGFDVLSLANNHSGDRGSLGVDRTLDLVEKLRFYHFGLIKSDNSIGRFRTVVNRNGIRIGFVGCTYGLNIGFSNSQLRVPFCHLSGGPNPVVIDEIRAASRETDIVIFTPHWGFEYSVVPSRDQKKLAEEALRAGARVIVGHHPHVIQPVEIQLKGGEIESVVAYSLGNLVSNQHPYDLSDSAKDQQRFPQRVGAFLGLEFKRQGATVEILPPVMIPTYMTTRGDGPEGLRTLVPAYPEIFAQSPRLVAALRRARALFSSVVDQALVPHFSQLNRIFERGQK